MRWLFDRWYDMFTTDPGQWTTFWWRVLLVGLGIAFTGPLWGCPTWLGMPDLAGVDRGVHPLGGRPDREAP